ncbi:MAG: mreD [Chlamydiales bacterium]|jgi:rod shape-determining protein MreD|nr:mreD [Chlamydiales bacterium]
MPKLPSLPLSFALALLSQGFCHLLNLRLSYFTPLIIIAYYQKEFSTSLWISLLIGLSIDLYSSEMPFGFFALSYTLSSWMLYGQKQTFFEDSFSTLPIMTFSFSVLSTLLTVSFSYLLSKPLNLSFDFFLADLLIMPLCDALYAFFVFTLLASMLTHFLPRRL